MLHEISMETHAWLLATGYRHEEHIKLKQKQTKVKPKFIILSCLNETI